MTRSRPLLLLAWGVLAIGSIVQVSRIGDEPDQDATQDSAQHGTDHEDEDDGEIPQASGEADRPADRLAFQAEEPIDGNATAAELPVDDPAGWAQAGPILRPTSVVATVSGNGVASLADAGPGDPVHWFPNPTQFGGPRVFLVLDDTSSEDYVKVSLPVMPNGQEGWIPRAAVELSTIEYRALVDLSDRSVTVWQGDEVVATTAAVTGKQTTPTPVGLFFVRDVIAQTDPGGDYGPFILALSGFSETLDSFDGGLPALALHGTNRPEQVGSARSSGCVRVPNEIISLLAEAVPLGTPVAVVA